MPKTRTGEGEIAETVLQILATMPNGEATIQQLVSRVPKMINLTEGDLAQSDTRQYEAMWEQIVRNIVSHKAVEGNIIAEGLPIAYSSPATAIRPILKRSRVP